MIMTINNILHYISNYNYNSKKNTWTRNRQSILKSQLPFLIKQTLIDSFTKNKEWIFLTELDTTEFSDLINKYIEDTELQSQNQEAEKIPATTYIISYINNNRNLWEINGNFSQVYFIKNNIKRSVACDDLLNYIINDNNNNPYKYNTEELKAAYNVIINEWKSLCVANLYNILRYNTNSLSNKKLYIKGLFNFLQPTCSLEIFNTLLTHWAWQVKRKILTLPVQNHIWLNFFGATGIGKTVFLKELVKPLIEFTSTTSIGKLFDDTREIKRLTENFVLIFDELSVNVDSESGSLSSDNKNILKSILTGDKLDARVYQTQQQAKRDITFSCISSANSHLYDVIFDETSMRRFFDIICEAKKPESYYEINNIYKLTLDFWQGIDENNDAGYFDPNNEIGKQITAIQNSYYPTKTTTAQWIKTLKITAGNTPAVDCFTDYTNWCKNTGNRSKNLQNYIVDLKHILPNAVNLDGSISISDPSSILKKPHMVSLNTNKDYTQPDNITEEIF